MAPATALFGRATRDFRRVWRQLLMTDVVFRTVGLVLLAPLAGLIVRMVVATSGRSVVADKAIVSFVLHPIGLLGIGVLASVGLATVGFQQAGLMVVGFGTARGRSVGYLTALHFVVDRWRAILSLTARIVVRALAIAAPFLVVGGVVFIWLLSERDIYYYVSTRPTELWLALGIIGPTLAVGAVVLGRFALGWLLSFPLMLVEERAPVDALKTAAERVQGRRKLAAALLVGWLLLSTLLSAVAVLLVRLVGVFVSGVIGASATELVVVAGGLLALWAVANFLATFASASIAALLLVHVHFEIKGESGVSDAADIPELAARQSPRSTGRQVAAGLVAALLIALLVGATAVRDLAEPSDAVAIAHRGAATFAPENTLAAVERAIVDGADYVEIDVQETADGRVVVFHDDSFARVSGVDLFIWDATWDQLQELDIGSWYAPEFADQRTPLLEQVLEAARGRTRVLIELKYYGHEQRLEERVVEIVERLGMADQVAIMTFDYDVVQRLMAERPGWRIGLLSSVALGDLARVNADFVAVSNRMATGSFVRAAHRAGKEVMVWTVYDRLTAFALISRGVDGLIADDPAMVAGVRAIHNELDAVERLIADIAILTGALVVDDEEAAQ